MSKCWVLNTGRLRLKTWTKRCFLLMTVLGVLSGGGLYSYAHTPLYGPTDFVLEPSHFVQVVSQLERQKVIGWSWPFYVLGRIMGAEKRIKAGSYQLTQLTTPWGLLKKLVAGDTSMVVFRIQEGWHWPQLKAALLADPDLKQDIRGLSDAQLAARLRLPHTYPEGLFFPDTYHMSRGSSAIDLLSYAHRRLNHKLKSAWDTRDSSLPFKSPYEVLILASLVEKETGHPADRPIVAGVFVNRLKIGMHLQTDPSVIYGLGSRFNGDLRRKHLREDTAYNSYTRRGLPPTPIAMVGEAALKAATHPARTAALYFVARGDGRSQFSNSLKDHNAAVRKYTLSSY